MPVCGKLVAALLSALPLTLALAVALLLFAFQDLAVELGAPPAGYCFVHQGELSAETMEQVTSFRSRNVPPAFWELD